MTTVNAGEFSNYLNLDYAYSLAEGVTDIEIETSSIVGRLVDWSADRGYEISREEAAAVLQNCIEDRRSIGCDE